jgi:hypothetical protein
VLLVKTEIAINPARRDKAENMAPSKAKPISGFAYLFMDTFRLVTTNAESTPLLDHILLLTVNGFFQSSL